MTDTATPRLDATTGPNFSARPRQSFGRWLRKTGLRHLFAIAVAAFALYPVVWILSSAFNANGSLSAQLIPRNITFENFKAIFTTKDPPLSRQMFNSFWISLVSASLNVLIAGFAAFAFSRFEFKGRRSLLTSLLVMQIFPQFLNFVALYVMAQQLGSVYPWIGLDTQGFLILVYVGGAAGFNAFLLKGFLDSIPKSLDEAARIDGAGPLTTFFRIIMPLARPMLAVIFIITFIATFGEYVLAATILTSPEKGTLPLGLQIFLSKDYGAKWGLLSAIALVGATPIVTVFIFAQRQIIGGLTAGGVKG